MYVLEQPLQAHFRLSEASLSRPSTVVMEPFWVAAGISKSSSGMVTVAESDLTTCLHPRRGSGWHIVTAILRQDCPC